MPNSRLFCPILELPQSSQLKIQSGNLCFVIVLGRGLVDLRLGLVELRLTQLYDRAQSEPVARLGQLESIIRLLEQLLRHRQTLKTGVGVEPRLPDIADNAVLQIAQVLILYLRLKIRFGSQSSELVSVEQRYVHVESRRGVSGPWERRGGQSSCGYHRREASNASRGDRGKPKIALRCGIALRGLHREALTQKLRAVFERLFD